jgi:hypothetical protein
LARKHRQRPVKTAPATESAQNSSHLPARGLIPVRWTRGHSYVLLSALTVLLYLPFSGRAFHVDDTLFVRAAENIARHPLDPYGFRLTWDAAEQPMSDITQNPPLASYYEAVVGSVFGWSERAQHLGSLLFTVLLILGTYRLAERFTRLPLLAALATLLTPGILVSGCSVMCDVPMLATWVWALNLWIEGLEPPRYGLLLSAALLVSTSALTKYFGIALIPLLISYSWMRTRRFLPWAYFLLLPAAALVAYQLWTQHLYGHGLLSGAAEFARQQRESAGVSWLAGIINGLSFAGGCALPAAAFIPMIWPRSKQLLIIAAALCIVLIVIAGGLDLGLHVGGPAALEEFRENWFTSGLHLLLFTSGGISLLALSVSDWRCHRDAESLLLLLWVWGTFVFAAIVNYTVNARSVLPMIPAAGILIARRVQMRPEAESASQAEVFPVLRNSLLALAVCGGISLLAADGDTALANSARRAAQLISAKARGQAGTLWFEGHWGFQYYMEREHAQALDLEHPQLQAGDFVAIPENNIQLAPIVSQRIASQEEFALPLEGWASTTDPHRGAGFYSSYWGPLPFILGPPRIENYSLIKVGP